MNIHMLKKIPLWIIPLFIAVLFFPLKGVDTSPDAAWYLTTGLNIYKGNGYVNTDLTPVLHRGPVFPTIIAISYWFFGISVKSGFYIVRFFFILNVLLVFFIGKKLYGKWVGLVSSLLVLSSFTVHLWSSYVLLDIVVSFFILLFILITFIAFEKKNIYLFLLSGLIIALTCLTKQIAIVFLPLPILSFLLIKNNRNKQNIGGIIIFILTFTAIISPWIIYVHKSGGDFSEVLGGTGHSYLGTMLAYGKGGLKGFADAVKNNISWIANYYKTYIGKFFLVAPIILFAWLFTLLRALIRKSNSDFFMIFSLLLYLPIMLFLGQWGWEERQNLIVYFLTYIIFTHFLWVVGRFINKKGISLLKIKKKYSRTILNSCLILLFGIAITSQLIADKRMIKILQGKMVKEVAPYIYGMSYYKKGWEASGWNGTTVEKAGRWIKENAPPNTKILCDWYFIHSIYFHADGNCPIFEISYSNFSDLNNPKYKNEKLLFMWSQRDEFIDNNNLRIVLESELLSQIKSKNIDYVVITHQKNFLSLYFDRNESFDNVAEFGDWLVNIKIYKVKEIKPFPDFDARISRAASETFNRLKVENPGEFERLKTKIFIEKLGFTAMEVDKIINGEWPSLEFHKMYE